MKPSLQAETVVGAGRGALIGAMFGAGWLGSGLAEARAFSVVVGPAFGFAALLLCAWSMYTIRTGQMLRKNYPPLPASGRWFVRRSFLLVVFIEVLAILFIWKLADRIHRPELGADW